MLKKNKKDSNKYNTSYAIFCASPVFINKFIPVYTISTYI
jgi:hypothetical protein